MKATRRKDSSFFFLSRLLPSRLVFEGETVGKGMYAFRWQYTEEECNESKTSR